MRRVLILTPLLLAVLVFLAGYFLLQACAVRLPFTDAVIGFCPVPADTSAEENRAEREANRRALEDHLATLQRELAGVRCIPEPPPVTPESGPAPDIRTEDWTNGDIGLLEGCWELDSDYRTQDVNTGKIVSVEAWQACFGPDGQGEQNMQLDDGSVCKSAVTASFADNGQLIIRDQGDVNCDNRRRIFERKISCDLSQSGEADCKSRQPGRGDGESSVTLKR